MTKCNVQIALTVIARPIKLLRAVFRLRRFGPVSDGSCWR